MSGFTGKRASGASKKQNRRDRIMNLTTARMMLPLVSRIVADVLEHQREIEKLQPELDRLDRHRHDLVWLERKRRYDVRDEISLREKKLKAATKELRQLGLSLIDSEIGRIGFPTLVNNRPAFFAWWPEEEGITTWHFATETRCRNIPASWFEEDEVDTPNQEL